MDPKPHKMPAFCAVIFLSVIVLLRKLYPRFASPLQTSYSLSGRLVSIALRCAFFVFGYPRVPALPGDIDNRNFFFVRSPTKGRPRKFLGVLLGVPCSFSGFRLFGKSVFLFPCLLSFRHPLQPPPFLIRARHPVGFRRDSPFYMPPSF